MITSQSFSGPPNRPANNVHIRNKTTSIMPVRRNIKRRRPYSRRRRSTKKRKYVRRFPMTPRITTYSNNVLLPQVKRVTMTYFMNIGGTSSAGLPFWFNFRPDSIYDPTESTHSLSHQPFGRDEAASAYNRFVVEKCEVDVLFTQIATNNVGHFCGLILDRDNVDSGVLSTKIERTRGKGVSFLRPNSNAHCSSRLTYNAKTFHGVNDLTSDHQIGAQQGSNPIKPAYLKLWIQAEDSVSTSSQAVYAKITMKYHVLLTDPIPLAGS